MSKKIESSLFQCELREGTGPLALKGTGVSMHGEGRLKDRSLTMVDELGRGLWKLLSSASRKSSSL